MLTGGTIGVFDLFHVGHLRFLQAARTQCDWLKVGVGADDLCARSKHRPVINEQQRMEILAGLRCVDAVCRFDIGLDNAVASIDWIIAWPVEVLFVSAEWRHTPRWQALEPLLTIQGIRCIWLPYTTEISSSAIRQRISRLISIPSATATLA
jgi:cytidyltransferase-like protein